MFVKICGITNEEDALYAVALEADAVGFIFASSPRQVSAQAVRDITRRLPPEVITVGVFRDQSPKQIIQTIQLAGIRVVQLHGHETPQQADEVRPYCEALFTAFTPGDPGLAHLDDYAPDALLIDSPNPGSGQLFDWTRMADVPHHPRTILAGGLTPSNVADAIAQVKPWGVDVSSGVEVDGQPGIKDALKVSEFIENARDAGAKLGRTRISSNPAGLQTESSINGAGETLAGPFDWAEMGL